MLRSIKLSFLMVTLLFLNLTFLSFSPPGLAGTDKALPEAYFSIQPPRPYAGSMVTFDASLSWSPDSEILKYKWDFDGDGKFEESYSLPTFRYVFEQNGTYKVTLKIIDKRGQTATFSKQVKVYKPPVSAKRQILLDTDEEGNLVYPGGRFKVAVVITINQAVSFLGLSETIPEGWDLRPLDKAGAKFKRAENRGQWLWMESMLPGKVLKVTYQVIIPENEKPSTFEITGSVSRFSKFEIFIGEESKVEVAKQNN